MVVMHSCDHHDVGGCVPDNRSRARMLAQLRAAKALSDALAHLFHQGRVADSTGLAGWPDGRPIVVVDLAVTVPLMRVWLDWLAVQPDGDDWHPPTPPADITIPTYPDDETSVATSPDAPETPPEPTTDVQPYVSSNSDPTSPPETAT